MVNGVTWLLKEGLLLGFVIVNGFSSRAVASVKFSGCTDLNYLAFRCYLLLEKSMRSLC